jgi:integrase
MARAVTPHQVESHKGRRLAIGNNLVVEVRARGELKRRLSEAPDNAAREAIRAKAKPHQFTRSWAYVYAVDGKERTVPGGSIERRTLPEAIEWARKLSMMRLDGQDPVKAHLAEKAAREATDARAAADEARGMTFEQCATSYISDNKTKWKDAAEWPRTLTRYVFPIIGKLDVRLIQPGHIAKIRNQEVTIKVDKQRAVTTFWNASPTTAKRVVGRVEKIIDWATVHNFRSGDNPARWRNYLGAVLDAPAKGESHKALPRELVPKYVQALAASDDPRAPIVEFAIRNALRIEAALMVTVADLNRNQRLLVVPPQYCKRKKKHKNVPHDAPLTDASLALIDRIAAKRDELQTDRLFPHPYSNDHSAKAMVLDFVKRHAKRIFDGQHGDITTHGFRGSFSTWVGEDTNESAETREFALGHVEGDDTVEAYRKGTSVEKRRRLMQRWGEFLDGVTAKVVHADFGAHS